MATTIAKHRMRSLVTILETKETNIDETLSYTLFTVEHEKRNGDWERKTSVKV